MNFNDLMGRINDAVLRNCGGSAYSYRRVASLADSSPNDPATLIGILEDGVQPEDMPAGSGTYARISMNHSSVAPFLQRGDEISTATHVYKIVDIEVDSGGMAEMLLRQDRDV